LHNASQYPIFSFKEIAQSFDRDKEHQRKADQKLKTSRVFFGDDGQLLNPVKKKRRGGPPAIRSYAERQQRAKEIQEQRAKEEAEEEAMMRERENEFKRLMGECDDSDDDDREDLASGDEEDDTGKADDTGENPSKPNS